MNTRCSIAVIALTAVILSGWTLVMGSQATPPARPYSVPNTPWGDPDFQGVWTNASLTPLERPQELAGKEFFTEQEAAQYEKQARERNNADRRGADSETDLAVGYNDYYWERGTNIVSTRRTSLIVDPRDGRIPPLTPEAQKSAAARADARRLHPSDGPEDRSLADRCIVRNGPPPMLPGGYNNYFQVFQSPGYVAILVEMIHDVRTIPLQPRPHLRSDVQQWLGDPRGRWEGKTLVVETTNFTDKTNFRGSGPQLRVIERFTRTDDRTLLYQFIVDDPHSFTRPWSGEITTKKTDGQVFEYSCHEENYSMPHTLIAARKEDQQHP